GLSSGLDFLGFAAGGVDDDRDADADHIEGEHGRGEEAHADRIGHGADDGGDQEDDEDRVADVPDEKFCVDDAEERQKKDEDRQLEGDAESEDDGEEEAGVVLDGNDGVEVPAEVADEDLERAGEYPAVTEPGTGEEEAYGCPHKGEDIALLVGVHAGRDEEPDLVEDEGRGEDGAADQRGLEVEVERVGGVGEVEIDVQIGEGLLDVTVEP